MHPQFRPQMFDSSFDNANIVSDYALIRLKILVMFSTSDVPGFRQQCTDANHGLK
jgi:hypothetical protein